jgi:hypothetical protein
MDLDARAAGIPLARFDWLSDKPHISAANFLVPSTLGAEKVADFLLSWMRKNISCGRHADGAVRKGTAKKPTRARQDKPGRAVDQRTKS